LTHEDYRNVFFNQVEISTNCRRMQSQGHVVYNVEHQKIALSYADDKRAWYSNNFSLPYGHYDDVWFNAFPPGDHELNSVNDDEDEDEINDDDGEDDNEEGEPPAKMIKLH
jgi:hypothetical protein